MALTREERNTIEELIKRIRKLEDTIAAQQTSIDMLLKIVNRLDSKTDMSEWTREQWRSFLKPYLTDTKKSSGIQKHNHTNDQQGGDCFAKLGANLINGD